VLLRQPRLARTTPGRGASSSRGAQPVAGSGGDKASGGTAGLCEEIPVRRTDLAPRHPASEGVGATAHVDAKSLVSQQRLQPVGERGHGVGPDHQPTAFGEQLPGVRVRSRQDCLAGRDRVGQRPGHGLVHVRIRSGENVCGLEPAAQLLLRDEPVDELDVVLEPELGDTAGEALAIPLALTAQDLGMRGAKHHV
jgi:hypothetical protein